MTSFEEMVEFIMNEIIKIREGVYFYNILKSLLFLYFIFILPCVIIASIFAYMIINIDIFAILIHFIVILFIFLIFIPISYFLSKYARAWYFFHDDFLEIDFNRSIIPLKIYIYYSDIATIKIVNDSSIKGSILKTIRPNQKHILRGTLDNRQYIITLLGFQKFNINEKAESYYNERKAEKSWNSRYYNKIIISCREIESNPEAKNRLFSNLS